MNRLLLFFAVLVVILRITLPLGTAIYMGKYGNYRHLNWWSPLGGLSNIRKITIQFAIFDWSSETNLDHAHDHDRLNSFAECELCFGLWILSHISSSGGAPENVSQLLNWNWAPVHGEHCRLMLFLELLLLLPLLSCLSVLLLISCSPTIIVWLSISKVANTISTVYMAHVAESDQART